MYFYHSYANFNEFLKLETILEYLKEDMNLEKSQPGQWAEISPQVGHYAVGLAQKLGQITFPALRPAREGGSATAPAGSAARPCRRRAGEAAAPRGRGGYGILHFAALGGRALTGRRSAARGASGGGGRRRGAVPVAGGLLPMSRQLHTRRGRRYAWRIAEKGGRRLRLRRRERRRSRGPTTGKTSIPGDSLDATSLRRMVE